MYHGHTCNRTFIASGDHRLLIHRVVDYIGNANFKIGVAAAGGGMGVLQNKPNDAEHATVAIEGDVQVRVGLAVQAGQIATSAASGWAVNVASSTVQKTLGRFITGAASGMLATLQLNPHVGPTA